MPIKNAREKRVTKDTKGTYKIMFYKINIERPIKTPHIQPGDLRWSGRVRNHASQAIIIAHNCLKNDLTETF